MATFKRDKPESEKELHGIIEKELDALEEGLELLKYEFGLEKGIPDFLCVDSGGRLVIIEVKLQEDENVLFQGLRYYNEVDKDRYVIARIFSDKKVDTEEDPRIVLIAEKFSDDIRRLSTLVVPDVELYEYTVLMGPNGERGICYHPVPLPEPRVLPPKPLSIDDHREYMTNDLLKPVFDRLREEIKSIGEGIEEYTTQSYVGFKYEGRQLAWIETQRKSFSIAAYTIDEKKKSLDYEYTRIETETEDYSEIFKKIKESYENLGGKLSGEKSESTLDPDNDPILRLIGLANEDPFADKIDEDLYGDQ